MRCILLFEYDKQSVATLIRSSITLQFLGQTFPFTSLEHKPFSRLIGKYSMLLFQDELKFKLLQRLGRKKYSTPNSYVCERMCVFILYHRGYNCSPEFLKLSVNVFLSLYVPCDILAGDQSKLHLARIASAPAHPD